MHRGNWSQDAPSGVAYQRWLPTAALTGTSQHVAIPPVGYLWSGRLYKFRYPWPLERTIISPIYPEICCHDSEALPLPFPFSSSAPPSLSPSRLRQTSLLPSPPQNPRLASFAHSSAPTPSPSLPQRLLASLALQLGPLSQQQQRRPPLPRQR